MLPRSPEASPLRRASVVSVQCQWFRGSAGLDGKPEDRVCAGQPIGVPSAMKPIRVTVATSLLHIPGMSLRCRIFALAPLFIAAAALPAQDARGALPGTTIPYFSLGTGPLRLTGPARPGTFISAVGRRAIAMGTEDGKLEL